MSEKDLTQHFDYNRLIEEEKEHYSTIEVTEDLKEGGGHANDSWGHYWERVRPALMRGPFLTLPLFFQYQFRGQDSAIEILSLGSGYCGSELSLARRLDQRMDYRIVCTDINEELFSEARKVSEREGLNLEFATQDLNFMSIPPGRYNMIFAFASLHHVINLERLFEQVAGGLVEGGIFHVVEVVGKNRKLIWDENEQFANSLLDVLPERVIGGIRLAIPEEEEGMEGIRQEEIDPLLQEHFSPQFEHRHGAFMRFICTHPELGSRLDPGQPESRRCLDFLIDADQSSVQNGILRPLELWGVYSAREGE